ncbi:MAG: hypothetical protein SCARUB_00325 [Candidatus Scalindua rubra]|uniref:Uncharacterized protein n=1 Tax=Candidatus Scalindua rubra TaxID=1872076 RepID=A0A1E3XG46_9BACT|nr:MAG: hypothetical protein SCARUB_00325 [Candidatus Scalindua rubra]
MAVHTQLKSSYIVKCVVRLEKKSIEMLEDIMFTKGVDNVLKVIVLAQHCRFILNG